jgi:hypothetical protein
MSRLSRRKWFWLTAGALALGVAAFNILTYRHAYAMTHFTAGGERTGKIESIGGARKLKILVSGINIPRPKTRSTPAGIDLTFETLRIESSPGVTLEAWRISRENPGAVILLFHGYATEKSAMLDEARVLAGLGYELLLVDFRGGGGSSGSHTTIGYEEALDVAAAWRFARRQWPGCPLILYGQSMGAAAILRAVAAESVAPDGVVLEAVFDTMLNTVRNRFKAMRVPSFPAAQGLVFWGGAQFGFNAFANNPADYARSVKCPVLFLHGGQDPRATVQEGRRVYENVPGERKTFREFPGMAHESLVAVYPEDWGGAFRAFVEGIAAAENGRE